MILPEFSELESSRKSSPNFYQQTESFWYNLQSHLFAPSQSSSHFIPIQWAHDIDTTLNRLDLHDQFKQALIQCWFDAVHLWWKKNLEKN